VIILPNRKCGTPVKGGTYGISRMALGGGLKPLTALAAPLPAEIANPRKPQLVDTARTLTADVGLWAPDPDWDYQGRFARLPRTGLADFFGVSQGYRNFWDVLFETSVKGLCRRVAQPLDIPLPCPVLLMHSQVVVDADWVDVEEWLREQGIEWAPGHLDSTPEGLVRNTAMMDDQPWREAQSLGHTGDDDFLWHPHSLLWQAIATLCERRLLAKFVRECDVQFGQGVGGLSWLTDWAMVLREDQDEVPDHLARKGVIAAVTEDDPRA
jgi:hypothetical protein